MKIIYKSATYYFCFHLRFIRERADEPKNASDVKIAVELKGCSQTSARDEQRRWREKQQKEFLRRRRPKTQIHSNEKTSWRAVRMHRSTYLIFQGFLKRKFFNLVRIGCLGVCESTHNSLLLPRQNKNVFFLHQTPCACICCRLPTLVFVFMPVQFFLIFH